MNSENVELHWKSFLINKNLGNLKLAIIDLNSCIRINPNNPNFYNIRAVLLYKNGQQQLAREDYNFITNRFGRKHLSKEVLLLLRGIDDDLPF
ncbi:MAG: tetratricopeptide repeat protein [Bacteroidia bacterium]|nr:tetratricopeptide repeat protein [Bacteroidia bacterium]